MYLKVEKNSITTQYTAYSTFQPPALQISHSGGYGYIPLTTTPSSNDLELKVGTKTYFAVGQSNTTTTTCYTSGTNSEGMSSTTALTATSEGDVTTSVTDSTFKWYTIYSMTTQYARYRLTVRNKKTTSKTYTTWGSMTSVIKCTSPDSKTDGWFENITSEGLKYVKIRLVSTTGTDYKSTAYSYWTGEPFNTRSSLVNPAKESGQLLIDTLLVNYYIQSRGYSYTNQASSSSMGPNETVPASMWWKSRWTGYDYDSADYIIHYTADITSMRAEKTSSKQVETYTTYTATTAYSGVTTATTC